MSGEVGRSWEKKWRIGKTVIRIYYKSIFNKGWKKKKKISLSFFKKSEYGAVSHMNNSWLPAEGRD